MARHPVVLVFAESDNDARAVSELVRYINPKLTRVECRKTPLVLQKAQQLIIARTNAERIAAVVRADSVKQRVQAVVAHQDCDAVEPAHQELSDRIEINLKLAGVKRAIAAAPAWEMETWWFLFPDAVAAICASWRRLTRIGDLGQISNSKEQLRRDLRPHGHPRCPDYTESDGPRIAARVREQQKPPHSRAKSDSYSSFLRKIKDL